VHILLETAQDVRLQKVCDYPPEPGTIMRLRMLDGLALSMLSSSNLRCLAALHLTHNEERIENDKQWVFENRIGGGNHGPYDGR
jgi:hypothetical protein